MLACMNQKATFHFNFVLILIHVRSGRIDFKQASVRVTSSESLQQFSGRKQKTIQCNEQCQAYNSM